MTPFPKIKLEFGVPLHGWLPTRFSFEGFVLDLEISDVPLDPMVQLCNALIQINKGIRNPERIIWHLEPFIYYFQLEKYGEVYKAIISESDDFEGPARLTKTIVGNFESIVLPLFRALKRFWSYSYQSPHWEELDAERIEVLTDLMKRRN